jgi:xanthine dehydrogenase accessory factor
MPNDMIETAWSLRQQGQPFVLATVVRIEKPASSRPGAKAIITADGNLTGWVGGSCAEPTVKKEARRVMETGKPRLIRLCPPEARSRAPQEGVVEVEMTCISGGTLEIYLEPYLPQPHLVVVGHYPITQALAQQGKALGYRVTVMSLEPIAEPIVQADAVLDKLDFSAVRTAPNTFIVVCSHGNYDEIALVEALRTDAPYVALVASKRRLEAVRQYLKDSDLTSEQIARLKCPAGLDLGAVTPEEIAVSILAEILVVRRDTSPVWHLPGSALQEGPTEARDPVCGMMVEIATARYVSEHEGQTYYFCNAGCQRSFEKNPEKYLVED